MEREYHSSGTKKKAGFRRSFFYYPGPKPKILWITMKLPPRNFASNAAVSRRSGYNFKNTTEHDLTQTA